MTRLSPTQWQALPDDVVSPAATRVLLALLATYRVHGRATVGSVAREVGRNRSTTFTHLRALSDLGLVGWKSGSNGTLRPLVEPVQWGGEQ